MGGGMAFAYCSTFYGCGEFGLISLKGMRTFASISILTDVAWIDWNINVIYDRFHIGICLLGGVSITLYPECTIASRLLGMVIVAVPMLILTLAAKGAFGGGDIKLMAASGFLLGWRATIVAVFLGVMTGGTCCVRMLFRGKLGRKDNFAFGPFLAIGLASACFYGEELLTWYLGF